MLCTNNNQHKHIHQFTCRPTYLTMTYYVVVGASPHQHFGLLIYLLMTCVHVYFVIDLNDCICISKFVIQHVYRKVTQNITLQHIHVLMYM